MLTRLKIEGFKSLDSLVLDPAQVNVFIGANGSGKSNLIEAIGLLSAAAAGRVDDQALLRRGVRPGVPALYKTALESFYKKPAIYLESHWNQTVEYSAGINNPLKEPKPAWAYKTESVRNKGKQILGRGPRAGTLVIGNERISIGALEPDSGLVALARSIENFGGDPLEFIEALADFAIFSPVTPVLRGIAPDPAPRAPVGLFGGNLPEAVNSLLDHKSKRFADLRLTELFRLLDWVNDISISAPSRSLLSPSVPTALSVLRFRDRRMRTEHNLLSGYDASEGALYVLFMLVLAMHPESPRLLAVDNFDSALNPLLAREMTNIFTKQILKSSPPRQAFLTTHQPQALDSLDLGNPRIRLFAVDRHPKTGETVARHIKIDPALIARGGNEFSLSTLWTMGRLGGVPAL